MCNAVRLSRWVTFVVIVALGLIPAIGLGSPLSPDEIEHRIDDLLGKMTLQEKLGQMSQKGFPDKFTDQTRDEIRSGRWGSLYNGGSADEKAEAQHIALTESRMHIPLIYAQDVIHGYRTIFPIPLGESCTWDPELIRQGARLTAIEASREGVHWTFAPMMDIGRDARWGRIAETLGEDPYLSGVIASAMVRGFQGDSLSNPDSIAACCKHYVGYGAAEGGRDYNTTWIPEPLLRDVYLVPFHAAEQAGAASFMSAFNDLNGIPASANGFTLRQVLRNEWGFTGPVVSDYQAVTELIPHGYASDDADAAMKAILAGVDMEMVSTAYWDHGSDLVASHAVDQKFIDQSVRNILRLKFELGLFGDRGSIRPSPPGTPDSHSLDIAKQVAEQSLVLLKNENGALPLSRSVGKVAVIGPLADSPEDQLGSWAAIGKEDDKIVRTPLDSLREVLGNDRVVYAPGLKTSRDRSHDGFADALDAARGADVVLLFLGEEAAMSGEASSRTSLNLPGAQEELVSQIAALGKPMIAVILSGRPLTFHETAAKMNAVLWSFDPGMMGGPAIVDTLFGDSNPSGRLTVTFPRTVGQCPIYYDHMNTGRPAWADGPASKDKYTSKYIDASFTPEYPFGYGLSYTHFAYANLQLSSHTLKLTDDTLSISADITNTGPVAGDEVVQLYTRQMVGSLTRPVRELKSFRRIHLDPGQTQTVQFPLCADDLKFFTAQGTYGAEPGEFHVWIAPDSASGLMGRFTVVQ